VSELECPEVQKKQNFKTYFELEGLIGTIIVLKKEVLNDFSSTKNH
jgi:hypothetical protein